METTVDPVAYKQVLVVLATAGVVIPLFHRLRLSPILGFLLVGILIGPSVLGRAVGEHPWLGYMVVTEHEEIAQLGELGVVFLLFMIGLELSFKRLTTMKRLVFGLGALQVVVSAIVIGLLAAMQIPAEEALIVGAALSLSSTAIVVELLSSQKRLTTMSGRASFSILLFQDLAVVPLLILVSVLGRPDESAWWVDLLTAFGEALLTIAVVVLVGRFVLQPFLRLVAATQSADLFLAATLLIVVGTALVTNLSGLSMALGAFIAGLVLAETEFRRQIETLIEPFKGLLLGAFFLLVGMGINLADVAARPLTILGLALLLVLIKAAIIYVIGRFLRLERDALVETALILGPGGEFAFVLMGAAFAAGVVTGPTSGTVSILVSVSMATIPLLSVLGRALAKRIGREQPLPPEAMVAPPEDGEAKVIVAGFGRVGRLVGALLQEQGISFLAVDLDPRHVARQRREGWPVYYGDSTNPAFLRNCGVRSARTLVVTLDQQAKVDEVVMAARQLSADLRIIARARDQTHAQHLYEVGVNEAVPETIEASLQLAEAVLVETGVPMGLAIAAIHERRDQVRKQLGRPDRRRILAEKLAKRDASAP
jgi:CPA2 family monovalent cation:H+ antiporter-2